MNFSIFRKISIQSRLLLVFLLFTILYCIMSFLQVYNINLRNEDVRKIVNEGTNGIQTAEKSNFYIHQIIINFYRATTGDEKFIKAMVDNCKNVTDSLNAYSKTAKTKENKALLNTVKNNFMKYEDIINNLARELRAGKRDKEIIKFLNEQNTKFYANAIIKGIDSLIKYSIKTADMNKKAYFEKEETTIQRTIISAIVVLILAVVIGFYIILSIVVPLKELISDINTQEKEGDLTHEVEVKSDDEVGLLAKWFNLFVKKLRGIVFEIYGSSDKLTESSEELLTISGIMADEADTMAKKANAVAKSSEEMNSEISLVSSATEQSSRNIEMISVSVEEMISTINEIAKNTADTKNTSNKAVDITKIASENVVNLSKAAQDIEKIVATITEISEQTNLLALNATIEAARAGEAGKGFAVVANEIKVLAKQTADATFEIKEKINGIQNSTDGTVSEINEIADTIAKANDMIDAVAGAVEEQASTTRDIASNVSETVQGIHDVTRAVTRSSVLAGDISRDISEIDASSGSMSANSSKVNISADLLSRLSNELKKTVNQFKI